MYVNFILKSIKIYITISLFPKGYIDSGLWLSLLSKNSWCSQGRQAVKQMVQCEKYLGDSRTPRRTSQLSLDVLGKALLRKRYSAGDNFVLPWGIFQCF